MGGREGEERRVGGKSRGGKKLGEKSILGTCHGEPWMPELAIAREACAHPTLIPARVKGDGWAQKKQVREGKPP
jgi:hypothetical protein